MERTRVVRVVLAAACGVALAAVVGCSSGNPGAESAAGSMSTSSGGSNTAAHPPGGRSPAVSAAPSIGTDQTGTALPPGVPANATLVYLNRPVAKQQMYNAVPPDQRGTLMIYDVTAGRMMTRTAVVPGQSPQTSAVAGTLDLTHELRAYFVPAKRRPSGT